MSFQIKQIQDSENNLKVVEIFNDRSFAKIVLNQGASLQELTLNSVPLIQDLHPLEYQETYASSILFPFVSRVKDGKYWFNGKEYHLETNNASENSALHGFVYNKQFKIIAQKATSEKALVVLEYIETNLTEGFPYTYSIQLTYTLTKASLDVQVEVMNTSNSVFPFTIGWHPYFFSDDLYSSILKFDSDKQVAFDDNLITKEIVDFKNKGAIEIKEQQLDNCFLLNSNKVEFVTPNYTLRIRSSSNNDFLQVYTPPKKNTIAIEPVTGISNSFNNKIGLRELKPKDANRISWQLKVE